MARSRLPQEAPKRYAKCWYDPIDEPELAELALRFALAQPITAALPPGEVSLFEMALDMADRLAPLTDAEVEDLRGPRRGEYTAVRVGSHLKGADCDSIGQHPLSRPTRRGPATASVVEKPPPPSRAARRGLSLLQRRSRQIRAGGAAH